MNDTYLRTWNAIPPTVPKFFSSFLAKITRNLALDRYTRSKAKKRGALPESLDELSDMIGGRSISDEIEICELGEAISRFLTLEKPLARRIFIKRYFFEDSVSDIAKEHGITVTSTKVILHRMRTRLADHLKKEGFFI